MTKKHKAKKKADINTKSSLAYLNFSGIQPEFNLLPCLCCQCVRLLHSLRTVLFLRRELKNRTRLLRHYVPRNCRCQVIRGQKLSHRNTKSIFHLSVHETTLKRLQVRVQDRDEKKHTHSMFYESLSFLLLRDQK